jgi:two-component system CheB/CheR fusion protein
VIEEMESVNEELQSANEELQSANEELQSTNEELQTSKEELQSTNEELATVNEELENRMLEATQIRDDLQNIIEVIETPVILLGMDLRIRGLTASISPALALSSADIGRPISHFIPKSDGASFEASIAEVINSVKENEQRLEGNDGRSYLARIKPYKTSDHRIKGAVISLVRSEGSSIQP